MKNHFTKKQIEIAKKNKLPLVYVDDRYMEDYGDAGGCSGPMSLKVFKKFKLAEIVHDVTDWSDDEIK